MGFPEFDGLGRPRIESQAQEVIPTSTRYDYSSRKVPGLTLFKQDEAGNVSLALYEATAVFGAPTQLKVMREEGCRYLQALNLKNAQKKFAKWARNS